MNFCTRSPQFPSFLQFPRSQILIFCFQCFQIFFIILPFTLSTKSFTLAFLQSIIIVSSNPGGEGTNPEQLFAGGYAACFESALRLVARLQKKPIKDASITARVTLSAAEGKYVLSVELDGQVEGLSAEEALVLMHAAHEVCPYSNATRGNIDVRLSSH